MANSPSRRPVALSVLLVILGLVLHTMAVEADAQEAPAGPGNPSILQAIQQLQQGVSALQRAVADLQADGQVVRLRRFYLSRGYHLGSEALSACEPGFHMASIWEIADPSHFKYDTGLGVATTDSGEGPPIVQGWVRTGAFHFSEGEGANCNAWTTDQDGWTGTIASLTSSSSNVGPWRTQLQRCFVPMNVWCVQD